MVKNGSNFIFNSIIRYFEGEHIAETGYIEGKGFGYHNAAKHIKAFRGNGLNFIKSIDGNFNFK